MSSHSNLGYIYYLYDGYKPTIYHSPAHEMSDLTTFDRHVTRICTYIYTYINSMCLILFPIPILYRYVFSFDTVSYNEILSSIVPKVNTKPLHRRTQGGRDPSGETQYV